MYRLNKLPIKIMCKLDSIRTNGRLSVGKGSFIHPSVHIIGKKNIVIGANTFISEGGWLNANRRMEYEKEIEIGSNVFIGKFNFFSSGLKIKVSDYVLTTYGCKFIGASHIISDPMTPYISSGTTSKNVIEIGVNCFIGSGAIVIGNVSIGHGSIIGAGAHVTQDVPPFSIIVGNPAFIIRRFSFLQKKWINADEITEEELFLMPNTSDYLNEIMKNHSKISMPKIALGRNMGNL